jgi:hypothetical protein
VSVVAETSFPFQTGSGTAVTEALWRDMAGAWMASGVIGATTRTTADSSLTPSISVGGGGPSFGLTTGKASILGVRYNNSASLTKTTTNNASSSFSRVDRLVLRHDSSLKVITAEILPGTPASSPVPPSTAPSGNYTYLTLARATVAPLGSTYTNLVDERIFAGARHYVGPTTAAEATFQTGDTWYQTDTKQMWVYDGTALVPMSAALFGAAVPVTARQDLEGQVTGTSYTATGTGAAPPGTAFIAPPSGRCTILFSTAVYNTGNFDNKTSMQVRTGSTVGSGTVVHGTSDADLDLWMALYKGADNQRISGVAQVSSLTPGASYNARMLHRVSGGTGGFLFRWFKVNPDLV